jgi:hypothetical protein
MRNHAADGQLLLLGQHLSLAFDVRVVALAPGCRRAYDDAEWRDAIVVIERGALDLECASGNRYRFHCGAVLWLAGLPLCALYNPGKEHALLVAARRRELHVVQALIRRSLP